MIQFKQLKVSFDYSHEHDAHNHDLVGYVIQKYPRKVIKTAILTRQSIDKWYKECEFAFPTKTHTILLGTISLIGTVLGMVDGVEDEDEDSNDTKYRAKRPRDPSAN
jgi:hypothetical protein